MTQKRTQQKPKWKKLKPLPGKDIHVGCACCSTACQVVPLTMDIRVGFGDARVTRDGETVLDAGYGSRAVRVSRIEKMAAADPDHDWRIVRLGPLHGETFQRHAAEHWVCVESNDGFA